MNYISVAIAFFSIFALSCRQRSASAGSKPPEVLSVAVKDVDMIDFSNMRFLLVSENASSDVKSLKVRIDGSIFNESLKDLFLGGTDGSELIITSCRVDEGEGFRGVSVSTGTKENFRQGCYKYLLSSGQHGYSLSYGGIGIVGVNRDVFDKYFRLVDDDENLILADCRRIEISGSMSMNVVFVGDGLNVMKGVNFKIVAQLNDGIVSSQDFSYDIVDIR